MYPVLLGDNAAARLYSTFGSRPLNESGAATFNAEANFPTQPAQAIEEARISLAHEDPGRPKGSFPPPRQGAQAGLCKARIPRISSREQFPRTLQPAFRESYEIRVTATLSVPGESNQRVEPRGRKSLLRQARLLRHPDFERVYKQGRRHFSRCMTVFYWLRPEALPAQFTGLRVGFTVSRALGGAVQRNRMRRRLREAVRLVRPWPGPSVDVVINPKKVVLNTDFEGLLNEVREAFVVIEEKLAPNQAGGYRSGNRKPEA